MRCLNKKKLSNNNFNFEAKVSSDCILILERMEFFVTNRGKLGLLTRSFFVWVVLCLGFLNQASASHVVGSDITYKCTSTPGIFEVTLVIYRDCSGATLCPTTCGAACQQTMQIQGADPSCASSTFGNISLNLVSVRDVNINPDCPNAKNTCNNMGCVTPGTYTPGIERYEFMGYANVGPTSGIPASCCNVRFSWTLCCRNGVINTGAANQDFYVDAVINRCLSVSPCNSSPTLDNDPFAVMCGGENYVFNNGAIDPDYDSLSFAFTPALQSFNSSVSYTPPFAFDRPMPWTGQWDAEFPAGIRCDPLTGDIMFTPTNASAADFFGVMAVEVKQWKTVNGVPTVIGITRRDIQMVVLANCPPNNVPRLVTDPPLASNPQAPKTQWNICAGEQLCFDVIAKDTDFLPPTISDTTYLAWNRALAPLGATFLPTYTPANRRKPAPLGGPREDRYQFCWTPPENLASTTPYYFTVSAKDNRCPNPGRTTRAFSVTVLGRADLTITKTDLKCGKWQVAYTDNTLSKPQSQRRPPSSVVWQISRYPGDYSMSQNPYTFSTPAIPPLNFADGGKYLVILQATTPGPDGIPCTRVFYDTIRVDTVVKAFVRDTISCRGSSVRIGATAKHGQPVYTYYWYNSIQDTALPPLNSSFTTANLDVTPTNTRRYTIKIRDLNGCIAFDSLRVQVKELPVGTLPDSMRLCYGSRYDLDPGDNGGNIRGYTWNQGDTTRLITRSDSGVYIVTLTDTFNCQQTDTLKLFVNRQIIPDAGPDTTICSGDTATLVGKGGQLYQWKEIGGAVLSPKSYVSTIRVKLPPGTAQVVKRYELTVYNSYPDTSAKQKECSVTDTVQLTLKPLPLLIRPQMTQLCFSEKLIPLPGFGTNQGGGTGVWSYPASPQAIASNGTDVRTDSLKNIPPRDTIFTYDNWVRYTYTAPASFGGCTNVDSAQLRVYGNPRVDAGPRLLWCANGGDYEITALNRQHTPTGTGPTLEGEEWTGAGMFSRTVSGTKRFVFDPKRSGVLTNNIITYKYTHTYNRGLGNQISCDNRDTVIFSVTTPPVIEAGGNLTVCSNRGVFNIGAEQASQTVVRASTTPLTGKSFWTSKILTQQAALKNDSQDLDPGHSSITLPSPMPLGYMFYYNDVSTGCAVKDSMYISVSQAPEVLLSYENSLMDSEYVCLGTGKQVNFRTILTRGMGGITSANVEYSGSPSFTLDAATAKGVFNSSTATAGTYTLTVKYTDQTPAKCSATASNRIQVQDPPAIAVSTPAAICSYESHAPIELTLVPAAGYKYSWFTSGDGTYDNDTIEKPVYTVGPGDIGTGQVTLEARTVKKVLTGNGDQCPEATASSVLTIIKAPAAIILGTDTEGCVPLTSTYTAGPTGVITPVSYQWTWENETRNEGDVNTISRTVQTYNTQRNGLYRVRLQTSTTVSGKTCSSQSGWSNMITHAIPTAAFVSDPDETTIAKPFFNFINQSGIVDGSTLKYRWNLGPGPDPKKPQDRIVTDANPVNIEYSADTASKRIWLYVESEHGCVDSVDHPITIKPDITVFIPNAFRPHGKETGSTVPCLDGDPDCNSVFKVAANGHLTIEIFVYNRWGQQVFHTKDAKEGWNGRINQTGEYCPQEVYVYQVNATSYSGKQYRYSGSVTLLR
jgi:hypothetical protein